MKIYMAVAALVLIAVSFAVSRLSELSKLSQTHTKRVAGGNIHARPRYAYVTFLCSGDGYLPGALMVAYTLKYEQRTPYDVVVMVTPDVSAQARAKLRAVFDHVISIEYLTGGVGELDESRKRFAKIFTKLQVLSLTQYAKVVFVDADLLPLRKFDALFDVPAPAGKLMWHLDSHVIQRLLPVKKMQQLTHGARIPEATTSCRKPFFGGVNAGLLVLEPNTRDYNAVLEALTTVSYRCLPEQLWLTRYYSGMWHSVDQRYNRAVIPAYFGNDVSTTAPAEYAAAYGVHFTGNEKPWDAGGSRVPYMDAIWKQLTFKYNVA